MVKISKNEYWNVRGSFPGKRDFGNWLFRIGGDTFWAMDCYYQEAEKRAKGNARLRKISIIYLLP